MVKDNTKYPGSSNDPGNPSGAPGFWGSCPTTPALSD
jgi:hypothetical protein